MKYYGLDVHKEFVQVCELTEDGKTKKQYRVLCDPEHLEEFGEKLDRKDQLVLEATFNSWAVYTILSEYVDRIVMANPLQVKAIAHARIKTDKVDAHILAQLLRLDFIPEVTVPDKECWEMRQLITHRRFLAKGMRSVKLSIRGLLNRKLLDSPEGDIVTERIRSWIAEQEFTASEKVMIDNLVELMMDYKEKLRRLDEHLKTLARADENVRLLMTIPGVNFTVAIGMLSAIDDVKRFKTPQQMASYFGLVPRVSQSAGKCYHGGITKAGRAIARSLMVEASHNLAMGTSPLSAAFHKIKHKKGYNVAVVALARKMVVLAWHMLTTRQPYRYAVVERTKAKMIPVTPDYRRAEPGKSPRDLDTLYQAIGLPPLQPPKPAEKRAAANSRRAITRFKKIGGKTLH